jgi:small subunit ribosomal protein S6
MSTLLQDYEALLVVQPELSEEAVSKLQSQFGEVVTRQGGRILECSNLGKRKLAYRIKRFSEGIYLQVRFQIPPAEVAGLKKTTGLMEQIVRFLLVQGAVPQVRSLNLETDA